MKTLIITALSLINICSYAVTTQTSFFSKTHFINLLEKDDTASIELDDAKIVIVDKDSAIEVSFDEEKQQSTRPQTTPQEYDDVDVQIIEGNTATQIILYKDGDTIKSYEMNYDFSDQKQAQKSQDEADKDEDKTFVFPKKKDKSRFKGHWAGFEMGLNNYLTEDHSMSPDKAFMEINTGKSWNFNFNFAQFSLPIVRDRFGLVSGFGLEWSNYHFANANTITKDEVSHQIVSKDLSNMALKKNRLQTTYLTTPLLLEAQLGDRKRISLSGGVIAGLKLGSHTKYKTADDKLKTKDDFYLQSFRYGFTARVNYDGLGLYLNYYNVPLFLNSKGPEELYPFAAGIVFSFD